MKLEATKNLVRQWCIIFNLEICVAVLSVSTILAITSSHGYYDISTARQKTCCYNGSSIKSKVKLG